MEEGAEYSVTLHNLLSYPTADYSIDGFRFCLYQDIPGRFNSEIYQLAWVVQPCAYGEQIKFTWTTSYQYQWGVLEEFENGARFDPSSNFPCELDELEENSIQLVSVGNTYQFQRNHHSNIGGNLPIRKGKDIDKSIAVGIAMDGKSVFATQGNSSVSSLIVPQPDYYVTFGNFKEGQVIDRQAAIDPLKIEFTGSNHLEITLDEGFQWHVKTLAD